MSEPLENLYFNWLCAKVMTVENPSPSLTYWKLLRILHSTEFVWLLPGDDNRAVDGLDLRIEFYRALNTSGVLEEVECSLLELLIAFSRRAEFETEVSEKEWFWQFVDNLGLKEFNDASNVERSRRVEQILYNFVWRTYEYDGRGGLFPLEHPEKDQTQVEIWYQFCAYLVELSQRGE